MKEKLLQLLFSLSLIVPVRASGQSVAIKTNLFYGFATLSPNLAVETALTSKTTLNVSGSINMWDLSKNGNFRKLNHWLLSAENRFWLHDKFVGHFVGAHGFFTSYNMGGTNNLFVFLPDLKKNWYEGYGLGTGFSYGYQWCPGTNWRLEATLELGYAYLNYDRFECDKCGDKLRHETRHYFGPTQIGVSLLYLF
ncbi:MAG: DUF3575 domain-containing protein [Bacteroides sp.]|nr:DUF3575 domain-containing protein [Bacteroides sp.]